jgi:peptidoglycan/LPS O-acetylase OafA/YrhL
VHQVLMTDYAPLFTAGIGFYLMYRFGQGLLSWVIVAGSFLLAVPTVRFRAGWESYSGEPVAAWPAIVGLAVCFLLIGAVALGWLSWVRGRWLVVLGATTYPLYLLHVDVGGLLLYRWQWSVPPALLVVLVTGAMILLAWLVHRFVERPLAPLLRRALQRKPKVSSPSGRHAG